MKVRMYENTEVEMYENTEVENGEVLPADVRKISIKEFYEWYVPLVGRTVSSFI